MRRPTPCYGEGGLSSPLSLSTIIVIEVRGSYTSPQVPCSFVGVSFIARLSFSLCLSRMLVPALSSIRREEDARKERGSYLFPAIYFAPHISYALAKETNAYSRILFVCFLFGCSALLFHVPFKMTLGKDEGYKANVQ